jgi:hypothetical protein
MRGLDEESVRAPISTERTAFIHSTSTANRIFTFRLLQQASHEAQLAHVKYTNRSNSLSSSA